MKTIAAICMSLLLLGPAPALAAGSHYHHLTEYIGRGLEAVCLYSRHVEDCVREPAHDDAGWHSDGDGWHSAHGRHESHHS